MKTLMRDINSFSSDEEMRPIVNRMKNKLLLTKKVDGKTFIAKLIAVKGDLLFYETKDGSIAINNINEITSCSEFHPKPREVVQKAEVV
jgi:hypothetical protein